MNPAVFGKFAAVSFQKEITYRFDYFMAVLNGFLYVFVFTALWRALYAQGAGAGGFTAASITAYAVMAMAIRISFSMDDTTIAIKVRDGSIATDLIRPVSFFMMNMAQCLGFSAFHTAARGVPILIFSIFLFKLDIPLTAQGTALGALSLVMGYLILFMLNYLFGLIAFWVIEVFPFQLMKYGLLNLLGGSVIPVDLFPAFMKPFLALLPFQHIFYTPAAILIGHAAPDRALVMLTEQAVWVGIMGAASLLVWNAAKSRLVIQGG